MAVIEVDQAKVYSPTRYCNGTEAIQEERV